MCLCVSYKKKIWKKYKFFDIFKVTKERSRIRSPSYGSVSQRYGSADPDPRQNATDTVKYWNKIGWMINPSPADERISESINAEEFLDSL